MVIWNWCHSARCILCWCGGSMVPVSDWRHNLVTANTGPQLGNMGYSNFGLLGSWHGQITKYNNNNKLACQNTQRFEKYVISFLGSFLALDSFCMIPQRLTPKQLTSFEEHHSTEVVLLSFGEYIRLWGENTGDWQVTESTHTLDTGPWHQDTGGHTGHLVTTHC